MSADLDGDSKFARDASEIAGVEGCDYVGPSVSGGFLCHLHPLVLAATENGTRLVLV
jgi:hypothetical protein